MDQRDAALSGGKVWRLDGRRTVNGDARDLLSGVRRLAPIRAAQVEQSEIGLDRAEQPLHPRVTTRLDIELRLACRHGRRFANRIDLEPAQRTKRLAGQ